MSCSMAPVRSPTAASLSEISRCSAVFWAGPTNSSATSRTGITLAARPLDSYRALSASSARQRTSVAADGSPQDALHQLAGGLVLFARGQNRLELGQGPGDIAQLVDRQARRARTRSARASEADRLDSRPDHTRGQLAKTTLAFQQPLELGAQMGIAGRQPLSLHQVADRPIRVADEVLGDVGRLLQDLASMPDIFDRGEGAVVEGQQIGPALLVGVEPRQPSQRPPGGRVDVEHPVENLDQLVGLRPEPLLVKAHRPLAEQASQLRVSLAQAPSGTAPPPRLAAARQQPALRADSRAPRAPVSSGLP